MQIILLIAKIIVLIIEGLTATAAVAKIAEESGVAFSELWDNLPSSYK